MYDRQFLLWILERLYFVYGENPDVDYMRKLYSIAAATPEKQITPNTGNPSEYLADEKTTALGRPVAPYF